MLPFCSWEIVMLDYPLVKLPAVKAAIENCHGLVRMEVVGARLLLMCDSQYDKMKIKFYV
jgi:hypothetical protein